MTPTSGIGARGLEFETNWTCVGGRLLAPVNDGVEGQHSPCVLWHALKSSDVFVY